MIDSSDLMLKSNMIMNRMYFDGLSSTEQKVMVDKIMLSYTKNKFKSLIGLNNYNSIMDLFYDIDSKFRNVDERNDFYNNYTKFIIGLMGKKQKVSISWDVSDDVYTPEISTAFSYDIIDKITTGSKVDSLVNFNYIYNLYMSDMKSYDNNENNVNCKRLAI